MTRDQPLRPANMQNIVAINQGRRPYTEDEPDPRALDPADAAERMDRGHLILDGRSPEDFGAAHVPGSYNIALSSRAFEQSAGWVLPAERPLVLVVGNADEARRAARKLAFVGLDQRVVGWLDIAAWQRAGRSIASLPQVGVRELQRALENGGPGVLDVREPGEWNSGHIRSARYMSYKHLPTDLERLRLSPDEPLAVVCGSGVRSSIACSILRINGFERLQNVTGGMAAWHEAGLPVVRPAGR